jgi:hypothetical protein
MSRFNDENVSVTSGGNPEYDGRYEYSDVNMANKIEKIYELPAISDMAGVFERAVFKDEKQRIAAVRLAYKNHKFRDDAHQEMLRMWVASLVGNQGLGRLDALFASINLLAPDMYRVARGMPKVKGEEKVHRGSDLRAESSREKEVTRE